MVMTRPPAYHPGNFLMKNMNPTNSGLTSGVASLDLMLGYAFYNRSCLASYWDAGSYVHLYMDVVQKVHSMTNYF